jgi:1-deoxy-D-xylulose-5-phosphate reductoisomerase
MGRKITVDSATLANKALEVIEAHHLFGVPYDRIDVVVHPQSVVHSFVEFVRRERARADGAPSMELPILYALTHPERVADAGPTAVRPGRARPAHLRARARRRLPDARPRHRGGAARAARRLRCTTRRTRRPSRSSSTGASGSPTSPRAVEARSRPSPAAPGATLDDLLAADAGRAHVRAHAPAAGAT